MRTLLVIVMIAPLALAAPPRFDPTPLAAPLDFAAQQGEVLDAARRTIESDEGALTDGQRTRAVEQIGAILDAWMSFDRAAYDELMKTWDGTLRYSEDDDEPQFYRWTVSAWRERDDPLVIARVDAASFEFEVVEDRRLKPGRSRSGASAAPTYFAFDPSPQSLAVAPGSVIVDFRALVETADAETRTLTLRFVWHDDAGRWLPLMQIQTDASAPGPEFYF